MSEYIDWDNKDLVRPSEDFTSDPDFDEYCNTQYWQVDSDNLVEYPTEEEDNLPPSMAVSEGMPSQEDIDWLLEISKKYHWTAPINVPVDAYPLYRAIQIALVMSGANYLNQNSLRRYREEEYEQEWVPRWEEFYGK